VAAVIRADPNPPQAAEAPQAAHAATKGPLASIRFGFALKQNRGGGCAWNWFVLRIHRIHVHNDHAVFGFDRQFRIRRNRIFELCERRAVLCRLTANTASKGGRIR
jgi:hypothetical protein